MYTQPCFDQIWWKKDISPYLYQKCFILCSKILPNVLYNLGLTILFPWQHTGFQTSPILKVFLATLCVQFSYLQMVPDIHDPEQAYKYVSLTLWPCITFFELKINEKSELPWQQNVRCVFYRTISLPSFNDLRCKLAKIALFTQMMFYWVKCMISSVISFAYFTHFSNLNISGTNAGICKR